MDLNFNQTGYERYSKLAKNIIALCNESNRMKDVIDDDNNKRKHYSLRQGLHVYISENGTVMISKKEISSIDREVTNTERWGKYDVYMKFNDRVCKFCVESDTYLKGIGIEYYANPSYGKDRYFLPHDFSGDHNEKEMKDQPMEEVCGGYGDIPNHFKLILNMQKKCNAANRADTRHAIQDLRALGEEIHIVAEKGYKEAIKALEKLLEIYTGMRDLKNPNVKEELLKIVRDVCDENQELKSRVSTIATREFDVTRADYDSLR